MRHLPAKKAEILDRIYDAYNHRRFISTDPVQFLHRFTDPEDQEVIGLVASGLAYGRVASIHASVEDFLLRIDNRPSAFANETDHREKLRAMTGFRHRWTPGSHVADLLEGVKRVRRDQGNLQAGFTAHLREEHDTIEAASSGWVQDLKESTHGKNSLLADPASGSACKRLFLFLRWMSRRDTVDPGIWPRVPAGKLVIPVDVHMHRVGLALGFTDRKQPNLKAALDITRAFRKFNPADPLRFDFALTRPGIMESVDLRDVVGGDDADPEQLLKVLPVPA
jgi:uncharacterized protein (TIGR02757 family)